ncbi:MAG: hypothetical protein SNG14_02410 [Rikenellaceae bacterium]
MKKSKIIASLLFVMSLFTSSCIREYVEPNTGADVAWFISGRSVNNYEPILIETGDYLGFMDCSLNTVTHKWEVMGSGCYMLTGTISSTDSMEIYIDPRVPTITDDEAYSTVDATIAVLFKEEGMKSVHLSNTYDSAVTHYYTQRGSADASTVYSNSSTLVGNTYLFDSIMYVQVFDPVIKAAAKVYTDPELTQEVATGTDEQGNISEEITIKFGETLYFVDDSYYEPNTWSWTCTAAGITSDSGPTESIAAMTFNALTSGQDSFKVVLTASRSADVDGYDAELPSGKSVATTIPLNIKVTENVKSLNPTYRLSPLDRRTVQIVLDNTTFDSDAYIKSQSGDVGVAEAYAERLANVKLNRIAAGGASSTLDCTDIEVGVAADGEQENTLNIRFAADGEASLYNTDESITLVLSEDIKTALGTGYSIAAGSYSVEPGLYENILPDDIADLDYLYNKICAECGLSSSRTVANVTANNKNIYFRAALYKRFFSAYDDDSNETVVFSLVRDPYTTEGDDSENVTMCLQADYVNTSGKLRIGTDYSFEGQPGMYYFTMDIAVNTSYNALTITTMPMTVAIVDPYPATHTANAWLTGSLDYYATSDFKATTTMPGAVNCWAESADYEVPIPVSATTIGYDLSLALVMASTPAGSRVYFRNFKVTNAAL